jgi:hypothetical protein
MPLSRRRFLEATAGTMVVGALGAAAPPAAAATVTVTVTAARSGTSAFSTGFTNADTGLYYPWGSNDQAAVSRATGLVHDGLALVNTQIMAWGTDDPWPDPSQPGPANWDELDAKVRLAVDAGTIPVLTLCEAPWWMKGQLNADGSTTLLTAGQEWDDIAYSSRVLDDRMGDWLTLVQRVAERYLVAPYQVRHFQVWNELKGYYNPATNDWDRTTSAGSPGGPNARHGYTYLYNQTYARLKNTAQALGIDPASVAVGGPYVVLDTWSSAGQESNPSGWTTAYGNFDQRSLDVVTYWLAHKTGAEFITLDAGNTNSDGVEITDAFTAAGKFADIAGWVRGLDPTTYPGAGTLPIWFAEWYADPYSGTSAGYDAAVKAYSAVRFLKAGGAALLEWNGSGLGGADAGLWTATDQAGGGQPTPWYAACQALHQAFPPGTALLTATSSAGSVEALASPATTLLINKTAGPLSVSVNGTAVTLAGYQIATLPTPTV